MKPLYSEKLLDSLYLALRRARRWMVLTAAAAVLGLAVLLSAGGLDPVKCALAAVVTAAAFGVDYVLLQKRALPLQRSLKLMESLPGTGETVTGVFMGYQEALGICSNVMTRRLRLDCGERVRSERLIKEVNVPALVSRFPFSEGETVTLGVAGNVVTGWTAETGDWEPSLEYGRSAYRVSRLTLGLALLCSILVWATVWAVAGRERPEEFVRVSVCAQSHRELEGDICPETPGIRRVAFSYMDDADGEQTALYLATYGAMEADVLLMDAFYFEAAFQNEGYRLGEAECAKLSAAVGRELRFARNEAGEATGVVLADRSDPAYDVFPGLSDWLQTGGAEQYVAFVNENSIHLSDGAALETLVLLLKELA